MKGLAICGAVGIVGGALWLSHNVTKRMVNLALDRETTENVDGAKKQFAGKRDMYDFFDELNTSGERLLSSEYEDVEIMADDGIKLVGHLKTCEKPERVIIAIHGWRSSWSHDFGMADEFWINNNCNVLYVEQRGQNNSGGEYMGFGILERFDCVKWAEWVYKKYSDLPIYLFGVSMGATTVLMASALELPENVRGIIADCGFTSPNAIWKHVAENSLHIPYEGLRRIVANNICRKKIKYGTKSYSATEALKNCKIPVLFIHGTEDNFVPVEMTYENYKACTSEKRLFIVPGADHGMSYYTDKKGYEKVLEEFWQDYE